MICFKHPDPTVIFPHKCVMCFRRLSPAVIFCCTVVLPGGFGPSSLKPLFVSPSTIECFTSSSLWGVRKGKEEKLLPKGALLVGLWVLWLERNARLLAGHCLAPPIPYDSMPFLASRWLRLMSILCTSLWLFCKEAWLLVILFFVFLVSFPFSF